MVIERWRPSRTVSPWRLVRELEEMTRGFDDFFGPSLLPAIRRRLLSEEKDWVPALEVVEKDDRYVVKAELPGIKESDVELSVQDAVLTLKGEKKTEDDVKGDSYYWTERSYGRFSRTISVPSNVDAEKIAATYHDGVLEIDLPKVEEVKPKKIPVTNRGNKESTGK